jgi:hypothetical protein
MMVKFADVVKTKTGGCPKCFSVTYSLPYNIDAELAEFLIGFGKPVYDLNAIKVLRINAANGFHIEGRLGAKQIKLVMPKKYEKRGQIQERDEFERNLADWLTKKLDITVELEG